MILKKQQHKFSLCVNCIFEPSIYIFSKNAKKKTLKKPLNNDVAAKMISIHKDNRAKQLQKQRHWSPYCSLQIQSLSRHLHHLHHPEGGHLTSCPLGTGHLPWERGTGRRQRTGREKKMTDIIIQAGEES